MAFNACNSNLDNKKVEEELSDTIEIIDVSSSDHLSFKGVPIDGTLKQYIAQMQKVGFSHIDTQDGVAILQGDFAGYKDCNVYVSTIDGNDVVSTIVVRFPNEEIWRRLYGDYTKLKGMLTEKYGKPFSVKEMFEESDYIDDDNDRMHAVRMDRCKYVTQYETGKGKIILWIEHDMYSSTFVCLQYTDKINDIGARQSAINDL